MACGGGVAGGQAVYDYLKSGRVKAISRDELLAHFRQKGAARRTQPRLMIAYDFHADGIYASFRYVKIRLPTRRKKSPSGLSVPMHGRRNPRIIAAILRGTE